MNERVTHYLVLPVLELFLGGQLAVDEQKGDLHEIALFCELLNGVPPVLEDAVVAVNETYFGRAADGAHEARVI